MLAAPLYLFSSSGSLRCHGRVYPDKTIMSYSDSFSVSQTNKCPPKLSLYITYTIPQFLPWQSHCLTLTSEAINIYSKCQHYRPPCQQQKSCHSVAVVGDHQPMLQSFDTLSLTLPGDFGPHPYQTPPVIGGLGAAYWLANWCCLGRTPRRHTHLCYSN